jgi:hypothetical protein
MTIYTSRAAMIAALLSTMASSIAMAQTAATPPAAPAVTAPAAVAPAVAAKPDQRAEPTAEEKAVRAKFRAACSADIAKYCADTQPAADATPEQVKSLRGKLRACLTTNAANVTPECKSAMVEREKSYEAKKQ